MLMNLWRRLQLRRERKLGEVGLHVTPHRVHCSSHELCHARDLALLSFLSLFSTGLWRKKWEKWDSASYVVGIYTHPNFKSTRAPDISVEALWSVLLCLWEDWRLKHFPGRVSSARELDE